MKRSMELMALVVAVALCGFAMSAQAQEPDATFGLPGIKSGAGTVIAPQSNKVNPGDTGVRAHTNFEVFVPEGLKPEEAPPFPGYGFETPASLACIYDLVTPVAGCNPNKVTLNPTGGSKAIAIVDAYDDPWAGPDLAYFSAQFGLPFSPSQFEVVYQTPGVEPSIDPTGDWELEESLDIEYAHAMAPKAKIYLVEANSNDLGDLLAAVSVASKLVAKAGGGEVSMSWGFTPEFASETSYDSSFTTTGVVYFAAAGDSPGTSWPSVSPNVVAAGGTTTRRHPSTRNFIDEITWDSASGGTSPYEARPSYQAGIASIVGAHRGVPDLSLDSNPLTGAWVWDSNYFEEAGGGWFIVGGTSLAVQSLAGTVNSAGSFYASSSAELTSIYSNIGVATDFRDITGGACGPYDGLSAKTGWDFCTGVGSDLGYIGK